MTETNNYLGFTIGPIVQTIASAKKTGHAWGGSYIFSYIMKQMILKLKENNFEILTPYVENEFETEKYGAGLFPDRCIVKVSNDFDKEKILSYFEKIKKEVLNDLATKIIDETYIKPLDDKESETYDISKLKEFKENLIDYFQIYGFIGEFSSKKEAMNTISNYLDSLELEPNYQSHNPCNIKNPLFKFFENKTIKNSFLSIDCFETSADKEMIKSLPEIALGNFIESNDIKIDNLNDSVNNGKYNEIYKKCAENKENFKKHYKYYAIIRADGDSVGKILKNFLRETDDNAENNNLEKYNIFSKQLFNFSKEVVNIIKEYGGLPIYIGGDDILAFVPLIHENETENEKDKFKTVFGLIENIDEKFNKEIGKTIKIDGKEIKPSLSYGLTINYYKYPLYEALNKSNDLLNYVAKKNKELLTSEADKKEYEKNAIALRILKHSGQEIQITLNKNNKSLYDLFAKLMNDIILKNNNEINENGKILQSFKIKIAEDEVLLNSLYDLHINNGNKDFEEFNTSIDNYFKNNFKKDIHKANEQQIDNIKNLLKACYYEYPYDNSKDDNTNNNTAIQTFERILRLLSFLNEGGE
ncbi:CRISPR-associated protein Cmr2 [Methanococcus voltae]|uniref:type III-B CRISPR-associated protein Cas10/Cmr2 n=1 Tax=Methanococcus voltae TaxID=2188 RepID=UPI001AE5104E|nr:type III-B CRISPR-associated protein Cas10/Cmr2 [Methanococcus voltae]MBP2143376.1 CRISPR-associated protein Cmr2 [Methanococcus voltae]